MYCPICGEEITRSDWRCEGCGTDLRRVIREEYWDKKEEPQSNNKVAERFRPIERSIEFMESWRSIHKTRRRPLLYTAIALAVLLLVLILGWWAFKDPAGERGTEDRTNTASAVSDTSDIPPPVSQPTITEEELKARLQAWETAWEKTAETKKIAEYASFYADDFTYGGKTRDEYLKKRSQEASVSAVIMVEISNLQVTIEGGKAVTSFRQDYLSDTFGDSGIKKLTWVKRGDNLLIISEEFQPSTLPPQMTQAQVQEQILAWRKAWEELAIKKELGTLPNFYSADFKSSKGGSLENFLQQKLAVAQKSAIIAIDIKNLKISILGDKAVASFHQSFRSESYADEGTKFLLFKLENGKPKIVKEGFHLKRKLPTIDVTDFWGD